mgnify:CR=1 FL=1
MKLRVHIDDNNNVTTGINPPKKLTANTTVTSNRTVVGFQITINYSETDYDILAYKKNEIKEYTFTLSMLRSKIEELLRNK